MNDEMYDRSILVHPKPVAKARFTSTDVLVACVLGIYFGFPGAIGVIAALAFAEMHARREAPQPPAAISR